MFTIRRRILKLLDILGLGDSPEPREPRPVWMGRGVRKPPRVRPVPRARADAAGEGEGPRGRVPRPEPDRGVLETVILNG